MSRLIAGTNWFLGYSHTSRARDAFVRDYQTRDRVASTLAVFLEAGVDTVMGPIHPLLIESVREAENRTGRKAILVLTPGFRLPTDASGPEPEAEFDRCREAGATFCLPHQGVTDRLVDRYHRTFHDLDRYTRMIRERGMIPGLSTHLPEALVYADRLNADVETYIQIYNAAGFLMPVEVDWGMRVIKEAKKPVMAIKPLAAGRLLPAVGLAFAWSTLREKDMVTVGCLTPDEAREVIELSLDFINRRLPANVLQTTRSKESLRRE